MKNVVVPPPIPLHFSPFSITQSTEDCGRSHHRDCNAKPGETMDLLANVSFRQPLAGSFRMKQKKRTDLEVYKKYNGAMNMAIFNLQHE